MINTGNPSDKYRFISSLGSGTYGKVHKIIDKETGQLYAIKEEKLDDKYDPGINSSFLREIVIQKSIDHPNIPRVREIYFYDRKC